MFTVTLLLQRTSLYPVVTQDTQQHITRSIRVSCLSRFLLLILHLRQISNARKPGHASLPAIKILYQDKLLASIKLSSRHCASAHLQVSCNRDKFPATYQSCTATLVMLNKICTIPDSYREAKTRAIPSLHRDYFSAKA